jgi:twitching motility protein PilU
MEIMLASPLISDLIFRGEVAMIKDIMAKSTRLGMQTFDQALFQLYEDGVISYEEAIRNADSQNELRLKIKLQSKREGTAAAEHGESLQLAQEEKESRF